MRNLKDLSYGDMENLKLKLSDKEILDYVDQQDQNTPNLLLLKVYALRNLGRSEEAIELVTDLIHSEDGYIKTEAFYRLSTNLFLTGDLDQANICIDKASEALKPLNFELDHTKWLEGNIANRKGTILYSLGNTQEALNLFIHSVDIFRELSERRNDKLLIAGPLNNLGMTYHDLGELSKALECVNEAVQIVRLHNKGFYEMIYLDSLARICWTKNDHKLAFRHAEKALAISYSIGNEIRKAEILNSLIKMSLLSNDLDKAKMYFERLETIVEDSQIVTVLHLRTISKALMLKHSNRGLQKYQAQELFKKLSLDPKLPFNLKNECKLHLVDLLLDELDHYSNEEVLHEILELGSEIYETAKEQHLVPLTVEILVLKAKLEIVNSNFQEAEKYLNQATILAEKRHYKLLINEIIAEQRQMQENFNDWEKLIRKGAPLREKLEKANLKAYLDRVISEHSLQ